MTVYLTLGICLVLAVLALVYVYKAMPTKRGDSRSKQQPPQPPSQ